MNLKRRFNRFPFHKAVALATALATAAAGILAPAAEANFWQERREVAAQRTGAAVRGPEAARGAPHTADGGAPVLASLPMDVLPAVGNVFRGLPEATPTDQTVVAGRARFGDQLSRLPSSISTLPVSYGDLREVHVSSKADAPLVVLIQDVHAVASAQENIAKMLEHLSARVSAGGQAPPLLVGMEGAAGSFEIAKYRALKYQDAHREVNTMLFNRNMLTGAEYFALNTDKNPPLLWGIEDKALYKRNVAAYRNSLAGMGDSRRTMDALSAASAALRDALFTPDLKALDDKLEAYHRGDGNLADLINALPERLEAAGDFPGLARFKRTLALERSLDFKQVEKERSRLIRVIAEKLPKADLDGLVRMSVAYRAGQMPHAAYYGSLRDLLTRRGVSLAGFQEFDKYTRYVLAADQIDPAGLFDELQAAQEAAGRVLGDTPAARDLFAARQDLRLADKLLRHELTTDEWARYETRRSEIYLLPKRLGAVKGSPVSLDALLAVYEDFYRAATRRNDALAGNLLKKLASSKMAVLIAGGFHTAGLAAELKERGVSTVTLTPKLEKIEGGASDYLQVFSGRRTPLEKILLGEKLMLGATEATASEGLDGKPTQEGFGIIQASVGPAIAGADAAQADAERQVADALRDIQGMHGAIGLEDVRRISPLPRTPRQIDAGHFQYLVYAGRQKPFQMAVTVRGDREEAAVRSVHALAVRNIRDPEAELFVGPRHLVTIARHQRGVVEGLAVEGGAKAADLAMFTADPAGVLELAPVAEPLLGSGSRGAALKSLRRLGRRNRVNPLLLAAALTFVACLGTKEEPSKVAPSDAGMEAGSTDAGGMEAGGMNDGGTTGRGGSTGVSGTSGTSGGTTGGTSGNDGGSMSTGGTSGSDGGSMSTGGTAGSDGGSMSTGGASGSDGGGMDAGGAGEGGVSTGGTSGSGGTLSTGGTSGSGGSTSTGGTSGTGGSTTGGTSGSDGGSMSTGGTSGSDGGTAGTGGTSGSDGGSMSTGGTAGSDGGTAGTGGTTGTGGTGGMADHLTHIAYAAFDKTQAVDSNSWAARPGTPSGYVSVGPGGLSTVITVNAPSSVDVEANLDPQIPNQDLILGNEFYLSVKPSVAVNIVETLTPDSASAGFGVGNESVPAGASYTLVGLLPAGSAPGSKKLRLTLPAGMYTVEHLPAKLASGKVWELWVMSLAAGLVSGALMLGLGASPEVTGVVAFMTSTFGMGATLLSHELSHGPTGGITFQVGPHRGWRAALALLASPGAKFTLEANRPRYRYGPLLGTFVPFLLALGVGAILSLFATGLSPWLPVIGLGVTALATVHTMSEDLGFSKPARPAPASAENQAPASFTPEEVSRHAELRALVMREAAQRGPRLRKETENLARNVQEAENNRGVLAREGMAPDESLSPVQIRQLLLERPLANESPEVVAAAVRYIGDNPLEVIAMLSQRMTYFEDAPAVMGQLNGAVDALRPRLKAKASLTTDRDLRRFMFLSAKMALLAQTQLLSGADEAVVALHKSPEGRKTLVSAKDFSTGVLFEAATAVLSTETPLPGWIVLARGARPGFDEALKRDASEPLIGGLKGEVERGRVRVLETGDLKALELAMGRPLVTKDGVLMAADMERALQGPHALEQRTRVMTLNRSSVNTEGLSLAGLILMGIFFGGLPLVQLSADESRELEALRVTLTKA